MKYVTESNVRLGMRVLPAPDWRYGHQADGAIYGIITRRHTSRGNMNKFSGHVDIIWVNEDDRPTHGDTYTIAAEGAIGGDLIMYDETGDTPKEANVVITNDNVTNFNNGIELCIDQLQDVCSEKLTSVLIEKFSNLKLPLLETKKS